MTGREGKVSAVLDNVAKSHNVPIPAVALAYVLQKVSYIYPIPTCVWHTNFLAPDPIHVPDDWR